MLQGCFNYALCKLQVGFKYGLVIIQDCFKTLHLVADRGTAVNLTYTSKIKNQQSAFPVGHQQINRGPSIHPLSHMVS
jgi:hypothetical protein